MSKALRIPKAKEAADKEWTKLGNKNAWLLDTVKPRQQVIKEAKAKGRSVHFGTLMDLCHVKHSELPPDQQVFKGRVVFRGDQVKGETGFYAVFSEQGTSASHLAAAKFLDAIARMPGNDGEDSDAIGAYHQVALEDLAALLGIPQSEYIETWISLPPSRRPKSWSNIEDPVCLLRLNLYGHPLAGLIWEKFCEKAILKAGFEKVSGWECLYVRRQLQLFVSVHVDDFKMAGKKASLPIMWKSLSNSLDLEPAVWASHI
jgi:hypothetical protein